jgi:hypothetical protein
MSTSFSPTAKGRVSWSFCSLRTWAPGQRPGLDAGAPGQRHRESAAVWCLDRYRYKDRKNVVWMMGGDMGTRPMHSTQHKVPSRALAQWPRKRAGAAVHARERGVDFGVDRHGPVVLGQAMTLNGAYAWSGDVNTQGRRAYASTRVMPAFLLEGPYDEEGLDGNRVNPNATQPVRRFQWWGWLSTIGGYISATAYVWPFRSGGWYEWQWLAASHQGLHLGRGHVWPFRSAWTTTWIRKVRGTWRGSMPSSDPSPGTSSFRRVWGGSEN